MLSIVPRQDVPLIFVSVQIQGATDGFEERLWSYLIEHDARCCFLPKRLLRRIRHEHPQYVGMNDRYSPELAAPGLHCTAGIMNTCDEKGIQAGQDCLAQMVIMPDGHSHLMGKASCEFRQL